MTKKIVVKRCKCAKKFAPAKAETALWVFTTLRFDALFAL
jgi:hypothetical protein